MPRPMPPSDLLRRAAHLYDQVVLDKRSHYAKERLEEARTLAEQALGVIAEQLAGMEEDRSKW